MNFSIPDMKGIRPTLSNLRRILRERRITEGLRFAYIPVLLSYKAANGKVYKLHPTKGWRPA